MNKPVVTFIDPKIANPFSIQEDQFLLNLVQWPLFSKEAPCPAMPQEPPVIDWAKLEKTYFLMPYLYRYARQYQSYLQPTPAFLSAAKKVYIHNLVLNTQRLGYIAELAQQLAPQNGKLLFVKGAAELLDFRQHEAYVGTRMMGDIDVLCPPLVVDSIHEHLIRAGHFPYDYNGHLNNPEELVQGSLDMVGHVVYNAFTTRHLELHTQVAVQENIRSFPVNFTESLIAVSRRMTLNSVPVLIPKREHMLVYILCHLACVKDHQVMVHISALTWDLKWSDRPMPSYFDRVNYRLDVQQLRYLFQLRAFLEACQYLDATPLDFSEVAALLATVQERRILDVYLNLAASYLSPLFPASLSIPTSDSQTVQRQKILACMADYPELG